MGPDKGYSKEGRLCGEKDSKEGRLCGEEACRSAEDNSLLGKEKRGRRVEVGEDGCEKRVHVGVGGSGRRVEVGEEVSNIPLLLHLSEVQPLRMPSQIVEQMVVQMVEQVSWLLVDKIYPIGSHVVPLNTAKNAAIAAEKSYKRSAMVTPSTTLSCTCIILIRK